MKSLRRRRAGTQVYMLEAIVRRAAAAGQERDHAAGHVPRRGMIDQVGQMKAIEAPAWSFPGRAMLD